MGGGTCSLPFKSLLLPQRLSCVQARGAVPPSLLSASRLARPSSLLPRTSLQARPLLPGTLPGPMPSEAQAAFSDAAWPLPLPTAGLMWQFGSG